MRRGVLGGGNDHLMVLHPQPQIRLRTGEVYPDAAGRGAEQDTVLDRSLTKENAK